METEQLLYLLKEHFGYDSFRPLQLEIINDVMSGKDVLAILPTGGGKSLCFQLPALAQDGLTLVVSPLIALMKDQVDALQANGIAATFLNSTLSPDDSRARLRGLHQGQYRLLYVAPERLMLAGMIEDLKKWNVNLLAVDEAHCVSEWGHDFRPEYRQLNRLRKELPKVPMLALTATATPRVRTDIVERLGLRNQKPYVASFNRPNLTYRVWAKQQSFDQLLSFLKKRPNDAGIVYCHSRKSAESVAEKLRAERIAAAPYHAGLAQEERAGNQELFLRDEVRVICATIAFGMGINKPNVRFVVHYDLPKNIEGYYQETGRAGRDGLPGECLLLFSPGDAVKQQRFIDEKTDPDEQAIARAQLRQMIDYSESAGCRRSALMGYFGEIWTDIPCGGCDNCLTPRDTYDGTVNAQKFLSCIYRVREKCGFDVGIAQIIEILTGAETEKIRKWNYDNLSTYGIGKDVSRNEWQQVGRELIRLQYLRQNMERMGVLELTAQGKAVLTQRKTVQLTKPLAAPVERKVAESDRHDTGLFDTLRALRKQLADARNVPPYIVFSDASLRQMARKYPQTPVEFRKISGVGEHKLADFGAAFLEAIAEYLKTHERQTFSDVTVEAAAPAVKKLGESQRETLKLFRKNMSLEEIAVERGLARSTLVEHLCHAIAAGEDVLIDRFVDSRQQAEIAAAFVEIGFSNLTGVREKLGEKYDFDVLKLFRAQNQRARSMAD